MIRRFFQFLNVIALLVLLAGCLAVYVNPNTFWQLSFLGFAFPVMLLLNVFLFIGWLLLWSRFTFVALTAILLCIPFIRTTFGFHFATDKEEGIKLITWNTKNFDLYNWSGNRANRAEMMSLLQKENADVLCLQEFYTNNQFFHNLEYLRDTLGYKYMYFPPAVELSKVPKSKLQQTLWKSGILKQQWGVATFSKYPIIDTGRIRFDNSLANNCIYTDIDFKGKVVRVFNVHFQSIHLGYEDYAALDSLSEKQQTKWNSLKSIVRKMKTAYSRRSQQANAVAEQLQAYKGAKMLCGDFNDVPVSYTYHTARTGMLDAFVEKGKGFSPTYVNPLSIFRIDYVLHEAGIKLNSYRVVQAPLSDHYPVAVTFDL